MSHADQLIEIATELAMDAKDNLADLQRKLSAIETAKVEIEARLHTANHALERLSSFVSIRGSDLQCPRCWINNEVIASLQIASGGDSGKFEDHQPRRFPVPWAADETDACFIVRDHSGQALGYLYCENERGLRIAAGLLTRYEARRMPSCPSC